jgi:hypothetical protein
MTKSQSLEFYNCFGKFREPLVEGLCQSLYSQGFGERDNVGKVMIARKWARRRKSVVGRKICTRVVRAGQSLWIIITNKEKVSILALEL